MSRDPQYLLDIVEAAKLAVRYSAFSREEKVLLGCSPLHPSLPRCLHVWTLDRSLFVWGSDAIAAKSRA